MKTWAIVAIQMMSSLNMIATQSSSTSHAKRWFSWLSHQSVQILSGRFMGWAWTLATLCGKWGKMNHLIKFLEKSSRKHWNDFFQALTVQRRQRCRALGAGSGLEMSHMGQILFRCASISWIGYKSNRVFFCEISDQWIDKTYNITTVQP